MMLEEILNLLNDENTRDLGVKLLEDRFNCRRIRKGDVLERKDREFRHSFSINEDRRKGGVIFQFLTIKEKEDFLELLSPFIGTLAYPTFATFHANYLMDLNKAFIMKPVNLRTGEPYEKNRRNRRLIALRKYI